MAQETLEVVYATGVRTSGLLLGEEQSISKELVHRGVLEDVLDMLLRGHTGMIMMMMNITYE